MGEKILSMQVYNVAPFERI